jgi:hypothetical protein
MHPFDLGVTKISWEHPCEGSEPSQGSTKFSQTYLISLAFAAPRGPRYNQGRGE